MPSLQIISKVVGKKVSQAPDLKQSASKRKKSESDSGCTKSTSEFSHLKVGSKVKFPLSNKVVNGTLRFIGPTKFSSGLWCGIELSRPDGRNNGTVKGVKYFQCRFNYGIFVHAEKVISVEDGDIDSGKGHPTSQLVGKLRSKDSAESPVSKEKKRSHLNESDIVHSKLGACKEEKPHSSNEDSSRGKNRLEDFGALIESNIDTPLNNRDTENQVEGISSLSHTTEDGSNLDDKNNDMRAIIAAEVGVENSSLTIKIARSVSDDDDDKSLENVTKSEFEDGLLFYVTAHQTAPISQDDRHKSCPKLDICDSAEDIFTEENKCNTWPKYSKREIENLSEERFHNVPTKLRRRLSGIEKRIHLSHFRPPSPGSLKKSLSQSAVYPKENYVAYEECVVKKPRFLASLKRSVSNVTEYITNDPQASGERHVGKRWARREKTAPNLFGDDVVDEPHDEDKTGGLNKCSYLENRCSERDIHEERKNEVLECEDVPVKDAILDMSNSFVVIDDVDDQDEKETLEKAEPTENGVISLSSASLLEEDLVIIETVTSEKIALKDHDVCELSTVKDPAGNIECNDEPVLKNEEKPGNVIDRPQIVGKSSQEQAGVGLPQPAKSRLTKHLSHKKDKPVSKVIQGKTSSPVAVGSKESSSIIRPMSTRLSQSHVELSKKAETPRTSSDNNRGRLPKKLNKRVSDLVANFEKTKDGDVQQKGSRSNVDATSETNERKQLNFGKRREAANDKEIKSNNLRVTPRKTSQVNKEELAGKETLSKQYLKEDGKKKVHHSHKDTSTGNQGTSRGSTIATGRSGIPGYSKRNQKAPNDSSRKPSATPNCSALKQEKSDDASILSSRNERGVSIAEPSTKAHEEIKILKARCLDCEKQICDLKNGIDEKNLAMEAFIIVIKQYIQMFEEQSGKQRQLHHDNRQLVNELKCQTNLTASNVEKCRYLEKALANLTENHGQQIDELNVTHALETENLLDELNQKHQREMGQANTKFDKEISRLKDYHDDKISKLQSEHEAAMKSLKDDFEKAFNSKDQELSRTKEDITHQFKKEKEEICLEYEERLQDLKNRLASAEQQCHQFEVKSRELQFELDKDLESKIQGALAKYKDLPAELESLQAVIEMKNEDIKKSRAHNMELQKRLEDYYELEKKYVKLSHEKEAIDAALQNKVKCERQLSVEKESLQATLEKEARKVKRLSMEKEELMWKVSNANSSLSLSSPSLNIDLSATSNGFQSTPNTTRSLNRSLKTQSLYLPPLDDEDYTVL